MDRIDTWMEMVRGLHSEWTPHKSQVKIGRALFAKGYKRIFAKCGRNFGKTELILYLLWRYAKEYPGSENYYFGPFKNQATEIIWAPQRLQSFGPREWLNPGSKGINNTENRLNFTNGSFIKLDGADNIEAHRGTKPKGLTVFDEFKDFKYGFVKAFLPNLTAHKAPLIIIGTPPEVEDHLFYQFEDDFRDDDNKAFFEFTSFDNPHLDVEELEKEKAGYYKRGEHDVWEREYMVRKVFGGINSIFPMLDEKKHVMKHSAMMRELKRDAKKLQYIYVCDPGTTTCFGVLFCALNPYTKKFYVLDCIYEKKQSETSTSRIGQRIMEAKHLYNSQLYLRADWSAVYDEAAAWFATEMIDQFDEAMMPTSKASKPKEKGLSLVKDMLIHDCLVISDKAAELLSEMRNYVRDDRGNIPKINDHLIDCLRYALNHLHYDMNHVKEQGRIELERKEQKPWYKVSDDFDNVSDDLELLRDETF